MNKGKKMKYVIIPILLTPFISNTTYYTAPQDLIVLASVSAYTASTDETDDTPTLTASGKMVSSKTIACPSKLSLGTKVKINDKLYVCEDRMNKRYRQNEYYDIWMGSKKEAIGWGRKIIPVTILQ